MPYPNYHAARIRNPDDFIADSFRVHPLTNQDGDPIGINIILGKLKGGDGTMQEQSYRFDKNKFTVVEAKKWLKDHDVKYIDFEPASDKSKKVEPKFDKIEYKNIAIDIIECKENLTEQLGIFKGNMATEDLDRGNDIISSDAFDSSLERYKSNNRNIRLFYQHNTSELPVGIIPADKVYKNGKNWNVTGELNLNTQRGKDIYELMKQGALTDLSIGFSILDQEYQDGIRIIKELELWEVSIVSEPMNPKAIINEIKAIIAFQDYPIADKDTEWDGNAAEKRVRKFTKAEDKPNIAYRNAHMWYDADNQDLFGSYKLLFVDVIDNKLQVIPRAIFEKAALLHGARAGLDIPEKDKIQLAKLVNKYYDKMGLESPLKSKSYLQKYNYEDIIGKIKTKRDFEAVLRDCGAFSRKVATYLSSLIREFEKEELKYSILNYKKIYNNLLEVKNMFDNL